ncbi:MAG: putative porin, partial [Alteromonadaceae bacterium]|nr:putative porin [Alteromonadaceae bacterium]
TQVGTEQYISVKASAVFYGDELDDNEDSMSASAEFYFSKKTSVNVGALLTGDTDGYFIGATHFFDDNSSVSINYADYDRSITTETADNSQNSKHWGIGYQYQF